MSLRRIRQYPAPPQGEVEVSVLCDYIGVLAREIQSEAFERIRDFENFLFNSGEITSLTAATIYLRDVSDAYKLALRWFETDTGNRKLDFKVNEGSRVLDMSEDLTIGDGYDITLTAEDADTAVVLDNANFEVENTNATQRNVKITSAKAGNTTLTLQEDLTIGDGGGVTVTAVGAARSLTLNESLTIGDGNDGTLTYSAATKTLTVEDTSVVNQDLTTDAEVTFKVVTFASEYDNENSGATKTIDWGNGQKQKVVMSANCTFTFTAPNGPGNFTLRMIQDATGSRTATWPATVKWPGGTAPTLTAASGSVDICTFYYDGTNYFGDFALNYS